MKTFLFSVDVEDFPVILNGQETYARRVPELTSIYLNFLKRHNMKATFFVLGEVAQSEPEVIELILRDGHEIGTHGQRHIPLDKLSPEEFRKDVIESLNSLKQVGVKNVKGYRAPFLSITPKTAWAYDILNDLGFEYSSSVLPRYNPLYGWPRFGEKPKQMGRLWELPVTVMPGLPLGIPLMGGVYFRVLPMWFLSLMQKIKSSKHPILSYFHPYDLDVHSESKTCSWLVDNHIGNYLIFYNRKSIIPRLENIMSRDYKIIPHYEYLKAAIC